jgi:hypothetical protein
MVVLVLLLLVAALAQARRRPVEPRRVKLLYREGVVSGSVATFPCGCRFVLGAQERVLCASHQAIFDAEVRA